MKSIVDLQKIRAILHALLIICCIVFAILLLVNGNH